MKQPIRMVSSAWPRIPERLEQIRRELSIERVTPLPIPDTTPLPPVSTTRRAPFRKNIFIANPDKSPITTDNLPDDLFEELEFIGCGSSGIVSRKRHLPSGLECAVKVVRRTSNEEHNWVMELQTIIECNCDNIIRCHGYFIKDVEVWICMELMTTCCGQLLKSRNKPLPEKFIGAVAASSVKALNYLKQELNIIHRDVKPSNILVNKKGQIKLCDFGISGRPVNSVAKTKTVGCLPYMAPESLEHSSQTYDIKSDIWSLGITLFELATGKLPYPNYENEFVILLRIREDDPPSLPDDMDFSQEFRHLMRICLAKKPQERPDYGQLLEHPFIKKHLQTIINLDDLDNSVTTQSITEYDYDDESFELIEYHQ